MTLTHKTKNTWHIADDLLVLLNRADGVEIYCPAALAPLVLNYTWRIAYARNGGVRCVQTTILDPRGGRKASGYAKEMTLTLHRLIMENAPEKVRQLDQTHIDHEDGNPLNNHLDNLRWVTQALNNQNKRDAEGMPLRGVRHDPRCRRRPWHAKIKVENEYFYTAREAEDQYLIWKRQYHTETPELWYEQYAACQASGYWD